MEKVVGILGGMGPYATVMFLKNIMNITDTKKDWDHIRTITDNNVKIPSRSRAILYNEESPLETMVESCLQLQKYPVDIIVIPCNSACFWVSEIQKKVKIPIINIVDVSTERLVASHQPMRVTVLGGAVTYEKELYKKSIERFGIEYVKPTEKIQEKIVQMIETIKLGVEIEGLKEKFLKIIRQLIEKNKIDGVILACTEFTLFKSISCSIPIIDSSLSLAQFVVDYVKNGKPIYLDNKKVVDFWENRAAKMEKKKLGILQSTMLTSNEEEALKKWENEKKIVLNYMLPYLNQNSSLLELGCGIGRWSRILSNYVKEVDAVDLNSIFIKKAKQLSEQEDKNNIKFYCSSMKDYKSEIKYDIIVSIALIHYLPEDQFLITMNLIKNNLNVNGYAIFRESFATNKRFEIHGYYSEILDNEYHAIYRTVEEYSQTLGTDFELLVNEVTLPATIDKPETCQKFLVFKKIK